MQINNTFFSIINSIIQIIVIGSLNIISVDYSIIILHKFVIYGLSRSSGTGRVVAVLEWGRMHFTGKTGGGGGFMGYARA